MAPVPIPVEVLRLSVEPSNPEKLDETVNTEESVEHAAIDWRALDFDTRAKCIEEALLDRAAYAFPDQELDRDDYLCGLDWSRSKARAWSSEFQFLAQYVLGELKFGNFYIQETQVHRTFAEYAEYLAADFGVTRTWSMSDWTESDGSQEDYAKPETRVDGRRMVFHLGAPRSGTTLFQRMLGEHPDIEATPELNLLFREHVGASGRRGPVSDWTGLEVFLAANFERDDDGLTQLERDDAPVERVYAEFLERNGGRLLVDKSNSYSAELNTLRRAEELFEGARYLYMARHPYAAMESMVRMRLHRLDACSDVWLPWNGDTWTHAEILWAHHNARIMHFLSSVPPERKHRVRFEDLTRDPEGTLRDVCAFLGIPYDEKMAEPYSAPHTIGGDPNQRDRTKVDPGLAKIRSAPPDPVRAETRRLAAFLGYCMPTEARLQHFREAIGEEPIETQPTMVEYPLRARFGPWCEGVSAPLAVLDTERCGLITHRILQRKEPDAEMREQLEVLGRLDQIEECIRGVRERTFSMNQEFEDIRRGLQKVLKTELVHWSPSGLLPYYVVSRPGDAPPPRSWLPWNPLPVSALRFEPTELPVWVLEPGVWADGGVPQFRFVLPVQLPKGPSFVRPLNRFLEPINGNPSPIQQGQLIVLAESRAFELLALHSSDPIVALVGHGARIGGSWFLSG